jgi:hypothetical protein
LNHLPVGSQGRGNGFSTLFDKVELVSVNSSILPS